MSDLSAEVHPRRALNLRALTDVVVCPRCRGDLQIHDGGYACAPCGASFEALGGVPCLLPDGDAARTQWRNQLAVIHQEGLRTAAAFESEAARPGLLPTTRQRLEKQQALTHLVMREIDEILVPVVGPPEDPGGPIPRFSPLETVHLAHRDWAWPESDENDKALALVREALVAPLGKVLVLGAGACRLSHDLLANVGADLVVCVDIDPLVLTIAERISAGEDVALTEPRANAVDLSKLSAARILRAEKTVRGLVPLLANGLAPPVRAGAFDTVLTPWFTDLVPDLRPFIGEVSRALKDGGRWVHFGPLLYPLHRPGAQRFSHDEVLELLKVAGFDRESWAEANLDYSFSPLTGRGRIEPCVAFSAAKNGSPRAADDGTFPWLILPHLPVPKMDASSAEGPGDQAVAELADGKRSIAQITKVIGERAGRHPPELMDGVRSSLMRLKSQGS